MTQGLRLVSTFVASRDALAAPPFQPETVTLGEFGFLPFVRTGLAAAIAARPAEGSLRATVEASFNVEAGGQSRAVTRTLTLHGPGDITGLDAGQIVRREPVPGTPDAEETYLAHIEFDRPDLPWLFTPFPAEGSRLAPWIALVVCEAEPVGKSKTHLIASQGDRPMLLVTRKGELQPLDDNHLFAHAQIVGMRVGERGIDLGLPIEAQDSVASRLSEAHAPANLSRLVCPRRLDPGRRYIAALVPAFDCGVRAGRGEEGGTLGPAWTRAPADEDDPITLPAYDSWEFQTGPAGDFRSLAERIEGVQAPWSMGRRIIDVSRPWGDGQVADPGSAEGTEILECALFSPAPRPEAAIPATGWPAGVSADLLARLEAAETPVEGEPMVGPRVYARFQRGVPLALRRPDGEFDAGSVDDDWYAALNIRPGHRIAAGLGTRVVQKNQEALMQAAWAQVEGIRAANRALALAQFAETMNQSALRRHLGVLALPDLVQVTRAVHARVKLPLAERSLAADILESQSAAGAMTLAFRRQTNPLGVLARRAEITGAALPRISLKDMRAPYRTPDGVAGLSRAALEIVPDEAVAKVTGLDPVTGREALARRVEALAAGGTALARLGARAWAVRPDFRAGAGLAEALQRDLEAVLGAGPECAPARVAQAATLMSGLARSGARVAGRATETLDALAPEVLRIALGREEGPTGGLDAGRGGAIPGGAHGHGGPGGIVGGMEIHDDGWQGAVEPGGIHDLGGITRVDPGGLELGHQVAREGADLGHLAEGLAQGVEGARPVGRRWIDLRLASRAADRVAASVAELDRRGPAQVIDRLRAIVDGAALPPTLAIASVPLAIGKEALLQAIEPSRHLRERFKGRILRATAFLEPGLIERRGFAPVMAAPVFRRPPMFRMLHDYDPEWLVPGLFGRPETDFVTLLEANSAFAEAVLVGMSDEMGRELLWRDYPTDRRGTCFFRFWDGAEDELTAPIHRFPDAPLGSHFALGGGRGAGDGGLVLVIRGALVRRYPHLVASLVRGEMVEGKPDFAAEGAPLLFNEPLPPDYLLVGFGLSAAEALAGSYWVILSEHPSAPRFGLAIEDAGAARGRIDHDALDWNDLGDLAFGSFLRPGEARQIRSDDARPPTVTWPGHAGVIARTLLRDPVRAAWPAAMLIKTR